MPCRSESVLFVELMNSAIKSVMKNDHQGYYAVVLAGSSHHNESHDAISHHCLGVWIEGLGV